LFRDNLNIDTSTGEFDTIEIRLRRDPSDNTRVDLFWGDDNGGIGAVRRTTLPGAAFPTDNQFHIIQFPIADLISGTLNSLRFDPSALNGSPVNFDIDYIRIGSLPTSAPSAPLITAFNLDPLFGEIELTWTSIQGAPYRIESSPNLTPDSWTPAVSNLIGDAGTSTFLGPVNTTDQFFRVVLEN